MQGHALTFSWASFSQKLCAKLAGLIGLSHPKERSSCRVEDTIEGGDGKHSNDNSRSNQDNISSTNINTIVPSDGMDKCRACLALPDALTMRMMLQTAPLHVSSAQLLTCSTLFKTSLRPFPSFPYPFRLLACTVRSRSLTSCVACDRGGGGSCQTRVTFMGPPVEVTHHL